MFTALALAHLLGILLAVFALLSVRFEGTRRSVRPWRLFVPTILVLLCSLALLGDFNARGKEVWLIGFLLGIPFGVARAFWLRLRTDHAARLVRMSPVRDGFFVAVTATALAAIELAMTLGRGGGNKAMFAAAVALCAGYLGGRAAITRMRAVTAVHLDMK